MYVVKENEFSYWKSDETGKRAGSFKDCDKFKFWIVAYFKYSDQIEYGAKIVKIKRLKYKERNVNDLICFLMWILLLVILTINIL